MMERDNLINLIDSRIQAARDGKIEISAFYSTDELKEYKNEYLFFIKPELTVCAGSPGFRKVMDLMFDKLEQYEFRITKMNVISAGYLKKYDVIAKHYGVINALSRDAAKHLSSQAWQKFGEIFGNSDQSGSSHETGSETGKPRILGSLEFLDSFPGYDACTLDHLWRQHQTFKLAPGTYCAEVTIKDKKVFLINGFHPKQLRHFESKGRVIVTLDLKSDTSWQIARNDFIGKTNPADAKPGSLRNDLLIFMRQYLTEDIDSSHNGFHLSAGPVEALAEQIRYNSDFSAGILKSAADYAFGRILTDNFGADATAKLLENPVVDYKDRQVSIFDLTEEKDSDEVINLLTEIDID